MAAELIIDDYPELALRGWNRSIRKIDEEAAFALYEHNWRFVDIEHLMPKEAALIARLTREYGHGVLNV